MHYLDHGQLTESSQWRLARLSSGPQSAVVTCPACGLVIALSNHSIDDGGDVTPGLLCPYECGFDAPIRLMEWNKPGGSIETW